jgi:DNA-directed RNA polymerase specialized sigma24 family protein
MKELFKRIFSNGEAVTAERTRAILQTIGDLPLDNQKVLQLHFMEEMPISVIAVQLHWSRSKVNNKVTRGISLIKWRVNSGAFEKVKELTSVSC